MVISREKQISIVMSIPILNAIASTTQNYFSGIGSGDIRMVVILLFILVFFHKFYRDTLINHLIVINLVYLSFTASFATDLPYTFSVLAKYSVSTILFSIGYYYIKNLKDYQRLLESYLFVLLIIVISIVVANIFHLGSSDYLESTLYYGVARVDITMQMAVVLLAVSPIFLFLKTKKVRLFVIILLLASFILILLGIKRSAILALFIGYFIYLYASHISVKQVRQYIAILFTLALFSPLYLNTLFERFLSRQEAGRFDLNQAPSEEARFMEVSRVITEYFDGDIGHKLFGSELFNYMEFGHTTRMLHTDYATMFSGAGLIGLLLFLFIYLAIFRKILFYRKVFNKNKLMTSITAICLALLMAQLILGVGSTVHGIGIRAYIFLFIGASLGVLNRHYVYMKTKEKSHENINRM